MPMLIAPLIATGLTALIGEIAATGAILGIAGLTVSGIVTGAVTLGLVVGAEMLLSRKRGGGAQGDVQTQIAQPGTVGPQSIGPRFHAVGQTRVGGAFFFREVDHNILLYAIVINCGRIDSLVAHLVDDEIQITDGVDLPPYYVAADDKIVAPTAGRKYATRLVSVWNGTQWVQVPEPTPRALSKYEFVNATDEGFVSRLLSYYVGGLNGSGGGATFDTWAPGSGDPFVWDETRLARGLCCMYAAYEGSNQGPGATLSQFLGIYPNRYPQHSFIVRGEPVFDPRDPAQSWDDRSTWVWSRNPALIWAYYWTHEDGGRLSYDDIDWDSVAEAADYCDRLVPSFDESTEPFACCDMQWNTSEARADVEARILAACDGMAYERAGKQAIWIVQDVTPAVTLTAKDISRLEWDVTAGALAETNYIQASYPEPRASYANVATVPVLDIGSIGRVGQRQATIPLSAVTNFNQAYRLTHRVLKRRNPGQFVTITGGPRLLRAAGEFMVNIDAPEYGVKGKFLSSRLVTVAADLSSATMEFKEVPDGAFDDVVSPSDPISPSIFATSSTTPNLAPTGIPAVISWDGIPQPYITAEAKTYQVLNGAVYTPGTTPEGLPTDTTLEFFVQSRPVDPGTHLPLGDGSWSKATDGAVIWTNYADEWHLVSPALAPDGSYELRAWFRSISTGALSTIFAGVFVDIPSGP